MAPSRASHAAEHRVAAVGIDRTSAADLNRVVGAYEQCQRTFYRAWRTATSCDRAAKTARSSATIYLVSDCVSTATTTSDHQIVHD
jgi:hypothetical protein